MPPAQAHRPKLTLVAAPLPALITALLLCFAASGGAYALDRGQVDGVLLRVQSGGLTTEHAVAGFSSGATDAYDSGIDVPAPPAAPNGSLRLALAPMDNAPPWFEHFREDWRAPMSDFASGAVRWSFQVPTSATGEQVVLTAVPGGLLDGSVSLRLYDGQSYHDLRADSTVTFSADGAVHEFTLIMGDPAAPTVSFAVPTGSPAWTAGQAVTLAWSCTSDLGIAQTLLEVSFDGGGSWATLLDSPGTVESFDWTVPANSTDAGRVRVTMTDDWGRGATASEPFGIVSGETPLSGVSFTSPSGGDAFLAAEEVPVGWTFTGGTSSIISSVLEWRPDPDLSFVPVDTVDGAGTATVWSVPSDLFTPAGELRVRTLSTDGDQADTLAPITLRPVVLQDSAFGSWTWHGATVGPPDNWAVRAISGDYGTTCTAERGEQHVLEGYFSLRLRAQSASELMVYQEVGAVAEAAEYSFQIGVYDNDPAVQVTAMLAFLDENGSTLAYFTSGGSTDGDAMQTLNAAGQSPVGSRVARVEIRLNANGAGEAYADLAQLGGQDPVPTVTMTAPASGTIFDQNGIFSLDASWSYGATAAQVDSAWLDLSLDGGLSWRSLAAFEGGATTSYSWPGDSSYSVEACLRLTASNRDGIRDADTSEAFVLRPTALHRRLEGGWHLVALPLQPGDSLASAAFTGIEGAAYWYGYDSSSGYVLEDTLHMARSYWLALEQNEQIEVSGTAQIGEYHQPLAMGWNLVQGGYPVGVGCGDMILRKQGTVLTFAQAAASGWIGPVLYGFDHASSNYAPLDGDSTLAEMAGAWMQVYEPSCTLAVAPPRVSTLAASAGMKRVRSFAGRSSWTAPVVIQWEGGSDRLAVIGVREGAGEGFEPGVDAEPPPDSPFGAMRGARLRAEAAGGTVQLQRDLRAPLTAEDSVRTWRIVFQGLEGEPLVLDGGALVDRLPGEHHASVMWRGEEMALYSGGGISLGSVASGEELLLRVAYRPVPDTPAALLPDRFAISKAWPNPFNRRVQIRIAVPEAGRVRLEVFDLLGRRVERLYSGHLDRGTHRFGWRGDAASGTYLIRAVHEDGGQDTRRIVLVK